MTEKWLVTLDILAEEIVDAIKSGIYRDESRNEMTAAVKEILEKYLK